MLQILAVVIVIGLIWILGTNLRSELVEKNLPTTFDFLDQPAGVTIADSGLDPGAPLRSALLIGIKNTFLLAIVGIPLLTVVGTLVGVARLSTNWLVCQGGDGLRGDDSQHSPAADHHLRVQRRDPSAATTLRPSDRRSTGGSSAT